MEKAEPGFETTRHVAPAESFVPSAPLRMKVEDSDGDSAALALVSD